MEKEGSKQSTFFRSSPASSNGIKLCKYRICRVQLFKLMLCIVSFSDVLPQANLSRIWLKLTSNKLHKSGFTSAVRANKRYVISAIQLKVNVIIDKVILIRFGHALKRNDCISGTRRFWEPKMHVMRLLWKNYQLFTDLLDLCHALLNLFCLGRLIPKSLNESLHVSNIALLSCTFSTELLKIFFSLMKIARIIAGIGYEHTILKRRHVRYTGIHERAVVTYQQNRTVI